jgi:hypothetical protein
MHSALKNFKENQWSLIYIKKIKLTFIGMSIQTKWLPILLTNFYIFCIKQTRRNLWSKNRKMWIM